MNKTRSRLTDGFERVFVCYQGEDRGKRGQNPIKFQDWKTYRIILDSCRRMPHYEQNAIILSFLTKEVVSKSNKSVILQINMQ